ncbi:MAG: hypothetical protein AAF367_09745 [Pseudomonadota bacterium]
MWLKDIFAREFGFSDVQSNYSRVYAWMANQLGHMTLGMATAFFFIWIVETSYSFTTDIVRAGGWLNALSLSCTRDQGGCLSVVAITAAGAILSGLMAYLSQRREDNRLFVAAFVLLIASVLYGAAYGQGCAGCWNYLFLTLAMAVVTLAFIGIICAGMFGPKAPVPAGLAARHYALVPVGSRILHGVVLILTCVSLWRLLPETTAPPGAAISQDPVMIFAIAVAFLFVAAAVAHLCKDTRFIVCAALTLIGAYVIATGGAGFGTAFQSNGLDSFVIVLPIIFVLHSCLFMVARAKPAERFSSREAVLQVGTNVLIACLFTYAVGHVLQDDWRLSIAAGAASLTLWWVKEFASDLPNVHREIFDIGALRPGGAHDGILGNCEQVEADYYSDARMDARTDGLFYFAGAWIGAGVLTDMPVLASSSDGSGWSSGSEILGLLIFLAIFIGLGKNWAYRQLALDLVGADKASRLAVFHSALWLRVVDIARGAYVKPAAPVGPDGAIRDPLLVLRDFAGDIGDEALPESRFHHLIVFGARGSGRSPLGRAIASEAALADWPTLFLQKRRRGPARGACKRTARYIHAPRLLNYLRDIERASEISATPTVPLHIHIETGHAHVDPAKLPEGPQRVEPAASLVVIDDMEIARADDADHVEALLKRLNVANGQQTVWLIEVEEPAGENWDEALAGAINAVTPLLTQLADQTPADDCCRIGIALARRASRLN